MEFEVSVPLVVENQVNYYHCIEGKKEIDNTLAVVVVVVVVVVAVAFRHQKTSMAGMACVLYFCLQKAIENSKIQFH